jgi:predicted methyltransferase
MRLRTKRSLALIVTLSSLYACRAGSADTATPDPKTTTDTPVAAKAAPTAADFATVLAMPHRTEENRSRDASRHPAETLAFFEVRPESTVVELWPGGGWYSEILAPYLKDKGKLVVTVFDPNGPKEYYGTAQSQKLLDRFRVEAAVFGTVGSATVKQDVQLGPDGKVAKIVVHPFELAPPGTADVVLTFRNSHGWYRSDSIGAIYASAFAALKPGGIFGVEQHRANADADPNVTAEKGYLPESTVIAAAEAAGFELVEKSEINANPKDTKDHPNGVWSLPPSLDGDEKDKAKFVAIGESDRMTLKFRKPAK